jgi:hypothetical protein
LIEMAVHTGVRGPGHLSRASLGEAGVPAVPLPSLARVLLIGDSTIYGRGANPEGSFGVTGAFEMGAPARRLAETMRAHGLQARCRSVVGMGSNNTAEATEQYFQGAPDVGVTLNGWGKFTYKAIGGDIFQTATESGGLTFAFDGVDTVALGFPVNAYGTLRYRVDGGPWTDLDENGGGVIDLLRVEIDLGVVGAHTVEVERTASTVYVQYCEAWAKTDNVVIVPWGARGYVSADLVLTTRPWSYRSALAEVPFDIACVNIGINDVNTGVAQSTYEANLATFFDAVLEQVPAGRMFAIIPNDIEAGLGYLPGSITAAAGARGITVLDTREAPGMSDYTAASAAGLMFDTLHPNNLGYATQWDHFEPAIRAAVTALA